MANNKPQFTNSKGNWPLPPYAVFRCKPAAPFHNPEDFYYDREDSVGGRNFRLVTGDEQSSFDVNEVTSEMQEIKVSVKSTGRIRETLVKRSGSILLRNQFPKISDLRNEREIR